MLIQWLAEIFFVASQVNCVCQWRCNVVANLLESWIETNQILNLQETMDQQSDCASAESAERVHCESPDSASPIIVTTAPSKNPSPFMKEFFVDIGEYEEVSRKGVKILKWGGNCVLCKEKNKKQHFYKDVLGTSSNFASHIKNQHSHEYSTYIAKANVTPRWTFGLTEPMLHHTSSPNLLNLARASMILSTWLLLFLTPQWSNLGLMLSVVIFQKMNAMHWKKIFSSCALI